MKDFNKDINNDINNEPNPMYHDKGIRSSPIMMFLKRDTLEDKLNRLVEWATSINEVELAEHLENSIKVYNNVQKELRKNINIYKTNSDYSLEAASKINLLCHLQEKNAEEYISSDLMDHECEK